MVFVLIYLAGLISGMALAIILIRCLLQSDAKKTKQKQRRYIQKKQKKSKKMTNKVLYLSDYRQNAKTLERKSVKYME